MTGSRTRNSGQLEGRARELYRVLAAGDAEALEGLLDSAFRGETTEGLPRGLGGTYRGPAAMTSQFWWSIGRVYRVRAEPSEFFPLVDGGLLVLGRYRGHARDGGGALDAAFAHVLHFRGNRLVSLRQYTDSARWHDALTVSGADTDAPGR